MVHSSREQIFLKTSLAFGQRMCYNPVNILRCGGMAQNVSKTLPHPGAEEKAV
jgi:hypothetical protein